MKNTNSAEPWIEWWEGVNDKIYLIDKHHGDSHGSMNSAKIKAIWEKETSTNTQQEETIDLEQLYELALQENERLKEQNKELLNIVDKLPKWLNDAADSLDIQASVKGNMSVLSPKLRWYADKLTKAIESNTK